ncbi:hypothetical protein DFR48_11276 [Ciceribacter lividus]|uniref:Spy/CpxP family protein refolding chaperone n=1 Tax=Ciceribacter lividus TaxID=1197950 RepID=A0A6I7HIH9_9HYPH|nr:hypothetical protein [Ciceribacter lividus]RCW20844.1 hypothetical protein DFR48_11276 [Ciceribacter lividus]
MRTSIIVAAAAGIGMLPGLAVGATNTDPDWPCIQRKVPELSVAQVWNGDALPDNAKDWSKDPAVEQLVDELAARRVPMDTARKQLETFVATLPADHTDEKLAQVFLGLFEKLNREREQVISGIARYAGKQRQMAADLRKKASDVDKLRRDANADPTELEKQSDQLKWETRVFEERVQSLSYVCEVPTIIEQRLYGLSKLIGQLMPKS